MQVRILPPVPKLISVGRWVNWLNQQTVNLPHSVCASSSQFLPTINICWFSVIGSTAVSKTASIGSSPIASARAGLAQTVEQLSCKQ